MLKSKVSRIDKPWGYELIWAKTDKYAGKILHIKKNHELSLQYHKKKEESFILYSGEMIFVFEDKNGNLKEVELKKGDSYHILPGKIHRMRAIKDCEVFEVSTPELSDVVRLKDNYGRIKK